MLFYPKEREYNELARPVKLFEPKAVIDKSNIIYFNKRVAIFTGLEEWGRAPVVKIKINGRSRFCYRASLPKSKDLGVKLSGQSYYIDTLNYNVLCGT